MGQTRAERIEERKRIVLAVLRDGPRTVSELCRLAHFESLGTGRSREMGVSNVLQLLTAAGLVERERGSGLGGPWVYHLTDTAYDNGCGKGVFIPETYSAKLYSPGKVWSLEELLYWLSASEEKPNDPGMAQSFNRNRATAVAAVRAAIDARDKRSKGEGPE